MFNGPVPCPNSGKGGIGLRKHGPSRIVATAEQWEQIREEKLGPCRGCDNYKLSPPARVELHHVVFRSHGGGDIADNLIPLHTGCHELVHARHPETVRRMLASLTDAEYAHAVDSQGEGFFERAYGLVYERAV